MRPPADRAASILQTFNRFMLICAPMANGPTVLVTGGAGYIGAHAVLALREAGREVVVLDDLSTGIRAAVPADATLAVGDVGDAALVADLFVRHRIGAVMHFAGSILVPESVENPLKYYHNNTAKSRALIAAAVSAGVPHFIFSSTAATYGIPEHSPVREDGPQRPINPYGTSKLMTETMLPRPFSIIGLMKSLVRSIAPNTVTPNIRSQSERLVSSVVIRPVGGKRSR